MNGRQAAREAAKKIADLEYYNSRCKADIVAYNECIETLIEGGSPCPWCMDFDECQLEAKTKTGCKEWLLKDITPPTVKEADDDSKGIHGASAEG